MVRDDFNYRQTLSDLLSAEAHLANQKDKMNDEQAWLDAVSPEKNKNAFLVGTVRILAGALSQKRCDPDISQLWDIYAEDYCNSTPSVRAALMNGFRALRGLRLIDERCKPSANDCRTRNLHEVERLLTPLAKRLSSTEIKHIAASDYGMDTERQEQALTRLISSETLEHPGEAGWFPAEVVELNALNSGSTSYLACTAIVLLHAVRNQDETGDAVFHFQRNWHHFSTYPLAAQEAVYAAFRYLYESDEAWWTDMKASNPELVIPCSTIHRTLHKLLINHARAVSFPKLHIGFPLVTRREAHRVKSGVLRSYASGLLNGQQIATYSEPNSRRRRTHMGLRHTLSA